MLDKNPDPEILDDVRRVLETNSFNLILSNEALIKTGFLSTLIDSIQIPVVYVDFDFLYTGYLTSGIITQNENVIVYRPKRDDFEMILKKIIVKIACERSVVVIDSLNGIFTLYDEKDSGRFVNTFLMFLVCIARYSDSKIIVGSVGKHVEGEGWILTPTGRHPVEIDEMTRVYLSRQDAGILFQALNKKNAPTKSVLIPYYVKKRSEF